MTKIDTSNHLINKKNIPSHKKLYKSFMEAVEKSCGMATYLSWAQDIILNVIHHPSQKRFIIYILPSKSTFYRDYLRKNFADLYQTIVTTFYGEPQKLQILVQD